MTLTLYCLFSDILRCIQYYHYCTLLTYLLAQIKIFNISYFIHTCQIYLNAMFSHQQALGGGCRHQPNGEVLLRWAMYWMVTATTCLFTIADLFHASPSLSIVQHTLKSRYFRMNTVQTHHTFSKFYTVKVR